MSKIWGYLAGIGGLLVAFLSAFLAGKSSEKANQAKRDLKRQKKGQVIKRKVEDETKDMDASDITDRLKSLK